MRKKASCPDPELLPEIEGGAGAEDRICPRVQGRVETVGSLLSRRLAGLTTYSHSP